MRFHPVRASTSWSARRGLLAQLANTLRHAGARQLVIEVQENGSGVIVMARDDGRRGQFVIGHGLSGMRERFEMFGGSLSIASQEGEGFSIRGITTCLRNSAHRRQGILARQCL
jgi:glucose-6-phosphate-specific signal transduction histidine kinase